MKYCKVEMHVSDIDTHFDVGNFKLHSSFTFSLEHLCFFRFFRTVYIQNWIFKRTDSKTRSCTLVTCVAWLLLGLVFKTNAFAPILFVERFRSFRKQESILNHRLEQDKWYYRIYSRLAFILWATYYVINVLPLKCKNPFWTSVGCCIIKNTSLCGKWATWKSYKRIVTSFVTVVDLFLINRQIPGGIYESLWWHWKASGKLSLSFAFQSLMSCNI